MNHIAVFKTYTWNELTGKKSCNRFGVGNAFVGNSTLVNAHELEAKGETRKATLQTDRRLKYTISLVAAVDTLTDIGCSEGLVKSGSNYSVSGQNIAII